MDKRLIVIGVILAGAVAVALYVWKGGGDDAERPERIRTPAEEGEAGLAASDRRDQSRRERPELPAPRKRPRLGEPPDTSDQDPANPIRDHRGKTGTGTPRATFVVKAEAIRDLRLSLRPQVKACQTKHASEITDKARVQARLGVAVRGGVVTVEEVQVQHSGLPEGSAMVECARAAFARATVKAEGHPEVEHHMLTFPFNLPIP